MANVNIQDIVSNLVERAGRSNSIFDEILIHEGNQPVEMDRGINALALEQDVITRSAAQGSLWYEQMQNLVDTGRVTMMSTPNERESMYVELLELSKNLSKVTAMPTVPYASYEELFRKYHQGGFTPLEEGTPVNESSVSFTAIPPAVNREAYASWITVDDAEHSEPDPTATIELQDNISDTFTKKITESKMLYESQYNRSPIYLVVDNITYTNIKQVLDPFLIQYLESDVIKILDLTVTVIVGNSSQPVLEVR